MIRILLVDDQNLIQQGIKSLLEQEREFEVVAAVDNGKSAIRAINRLHPDIVLLDIEMPGMNGISVTKYINHFLPKTKVIILSTHEEKTYLVQALVAGAKAYILKDSLTADLKQAILAVNNGYSQIESRLLAKVINSERIKSVKHKAVAAAQVREQSSVSSALELTKTASISRQQNSNQSDRAERTDFANRATVNVNSNPDLSNQKPTDISTVEMIESEQNSEIPQRDRVLPVEVMPSAQKATTITQTSLTSEHNPRVRIRHRKNSSAYQNQTAIVPTTLPALSEERVAFGSNLRKSKYRVKVSAIANYLDRLTDFPQIRPIKLRISQFFQPLIASFAFTFRKYLLRLKQILNQRDTQKYLHNVGLMVLGGIIVLIFSSF